MRLLISVAALVALIGQSSAARASAARAVDIDRPAPNTPPMDGDSVIDRLTRRLFGSPLLRNSVCGEFVEEIVGLALEPGWELCGGDWGACDLRHRASGLRIQVKQSAARQSWHRAEPPLPRPRFLIAAKTGRWEEGDKWVPEAGRNAEIFIFAWHPLTDATADHRVPDQWQFYVLAETALPKQASISLAGVERLTSPVAFRGLAEAVAQAAGTGR